MSKSEDSSSETAVEGLKVTCSLRSKVWKMGTPRAKQLFRPRIVVPFWLHFRAICAFWRFRNSCLARGVLTFFARRMLYFFHVVGRNSYLARGVLTFAHFGMQTSGNKLLLLLFFICCSCYCCSVLDCFPKSECQIVKKWGFLEPNSCWKLKCFLLSKSRSVEKWGLLEPNSYFCRQQEQNIAADGRKKWGLFEPNSYFGKARMQKTKPVCRRGWARRRGRGGKPPL